MRRLLPAAAIGIAVLGFALPASAAYARRGTEPAIVTVYPADHPRGVIATSGGWAYCLQLQKLARRTHHTLVCGRYYRDGYTGYGLLERRLLDWGDPAYLASLAAKVATVHRATGGELLLVGVSYSGFGVATLASHHPELKPDKLIVIDSYLDLPARRAAADGHRTADEIDASTGGSAAALAARSVSVGGLAQLVRGGTTLLNVWSISDDEAREFQGATCGPNASAGVLGKLAAALGRPVSAWVTRSRHGHDLWDHGPALIAGRPPGTQVQFEPGAGAPAGSTCD